MNGEHLYEKIEAYLNGSLTPADHDAFEKELKADKALRSEVNLHRQLQNELGKPNKKMLRDNLKMISANQKISLDDDDSQSSADPEKPTQSRKWMWGLFAIGLLFGIWMSYHSNSSEVKTPVEVETEAPGAKEGFPNIIEPDKPVEAKQKQIPQANNNPTEINQDEKPLIASVDPKDFLPNAFLEDQIGSGVRGESYTVSIDESATLKEIKLNGNVAQVKIKGAVKGEGVLPKDASFMLMIYSNKQEDYNEDRSILNIPLNLQKLEDDSFPFQFNANLRIAPGLYYFIVAEKDDDEPLHVGSFEVTP